VEYFKLQNIQNEALAYPPAVFLLAGRQEELWKGRVAMCRGAYSRPGLTEQALE
jgi:hypothetical protein